MITAADSPWLIPGLTQRLIALHAQTGAAEMSMGDIADRLNFEFETDLTRNSIIGRCRRLGLPARVSGANFRRAAMKPPKVRMVRIDAPIPARDLPAGPRPEGLTIYQLGRGDCRFPLGEMQDRPPFSFCGQEQAEGRSYCAAHHKLTHHTPR